MGARRIRREQRQQDQRRSRIENGHLKRKERRRRELRMTELINKHPYPYVPSVMSWVSAQLGKPSTKISEAEVKQLVSQLGD